jgi:hypothetical protein
MNKYCVLHAASPPSSCEPQRTPLAPISAMRITWPRTAAFKKPIVGMTALSTIANRAITSAQKNAGVAPVASRMPIHSDVQRIRTQDVQPSSGSVLRVSDKSRSVPTLLR